MTSPETASTPAEVQEWCLWRKDLYGNQWRMPFAGSEDRSAVDELCAEYTQRGHHQDYEVRPVDPADTRIFIPVGENR
jgi:hypothetical protein